MGHVSVATTERVYSRLDAVAASRVADRLLSREGAFRRRASTGRHPRRAPEAGRGSDGRADAAPGVCNLRSGRSSTAGRGGAPSGRRTSWTRPAYAASWSQTTSRAASRDRTADGLRWVGDRDAACLARPPPDRACEAAAAAYAAALGKSLAKISIAAALIDISRALKVIAPRAELPWLDRMAARLKREARPTRGKESRLVPTADLLKLGRELMARAASDTGMSMPGRATLHRDGLMIALLALRAAAARQLPRHRDGAPPRRARRAARGSISTAARPRTGRRSRRRSPDHAFKEPGAIPKAVWRPLLAGTQSRSPAATHGVAGPGLLWLSRSGQGVLAGTRSTA